MRRDEEAALNHSTDPSLRTNDIVLTAPLTGTVVPLAAVPDPVFADGLFGDGIGMDPLLGELRAPCDGIVMHVARTSHAATLRTPQGAEILLHIGIDTVELGGNGFAAKVQEGDTVQTGDLLIAFDIDDVARAANSLVSVIAIANSDAFEIVQRAAGSALQIGEGPLLVLRATDRQRPSVAAAEATGSPTALPTPLQAPLPASSQTLSPTFQPTSFDRPGQPPSRTTYSQTRTLALSQHGGLHARPAARARQAARPFDARVVVQHAARETSVDSVVGLLGLGAAQGATLTLRASGPQALAAIEAVAQALLRDDAGDDAGNEKRSGAIPASTARAPAAAPSLEHTDTDGPHAHRPLLQGVCASPGIAVGVLVHWAQDEIAAPEFGHGDAAQERAALDAAIGAVDAELALTVQSALERGASDEAEIFDMHRALLDDPVLRDVARALIALGKSASFAWRESVGAQRSLLSQVGDSLLAERVLDLLDLERRVLRILHRAHPTTQTQITHGQQDATHTVLPDRAIVAADDFTPSDLASFDLRRVKGLAMARGGATTHAAILARQFGLPALVALGDALRDIATGTTVVLDASAGRLDDAPTVDDIARATAEHRRLADARETDRLTSHETASTRDGTRIEVAANIATCDDAITASDNGADGVGLLRTELLFMHRQSAPTAQEHRQSYQAIVDALKGRRAIIRTLDVGADKEVDYLSLPPETNPALGLRGIRMAQIRPDLLDDQLRGMLQVRPIDRVRILFPMVTDAEEVVALRERIDTLTREMNRDDSAHQAAQTTSAKQNAGEIAASSRIEVGVMIEVPAAALLADQLAQHADFLSIGTNDLTQYTLAMDRGQADLAARADGLHPAVLRLIKATVTGAAQHGKWVGVCGALASDPVAVPLLIGLGITELSVDPASVPGIKALVRRLDLAHCRAQAEAALTLMSPQAVRAASRTAFS